MSDMGIQQNVALAPYTTLHIGGPAEYFVSVQDAAALRAAAQWAHAQKLPVTILGGGSNVLIADAGISGLVIHVDIKGVEVSEDGASVLLTAGAGVVFDELVAETVERGWWGLENLSAIPGSVGATPVQNIGAYGVEIASCIAHVGVYDMHDDVQKQLTAEECAFGYRNSFFKTYDAQRYVITAVTYRLTTERAPVLHYRDLAAFFADHEEHSISHQSIRDAVCAIRANKFPDWHAVGTAGSFFKNPIITRAHAEELREKYPGIPTYSVDAAGSDVKVSLGWIFDKVLNMRGYREGNVGTYDTQALVLVNYGGACAADVDAFADMLAARTFDATGIHIAREVTSLPQ